MVVEAKEEFSPDHLDCHYTLHLGWKIIYCGIRRQGREEIRDTWEAKNIYLLIHYTNAESAYYMKF